LFRAFVDLKDLSDWKYKILLFLNLDLFIVIRYLEEFWGMKEGAFKSTAGGN